MTKLELLLLSILISFFGKYELPSLNPDNVTTVNVIVAHVLGEPKLESCDTGSLITLKEDVLNRGLDYTCVDDPEVVLYLMCADNPDNSQCEMPVSHA